MAVNLWIDAKGRKCSPLDPFVYELSLGDDGALSTRYRIAGKKLSNVSFKNLRQMASWIGSRHPIKLDVEALNFKLYYDAAGKPMNNVTNAKFSIVPLHTIADFALSVLKADRWEQIEYGTFLTCMNRLDRCVRTGAYEPAAPAPNPIPRFAEYRNHMGEVVPSMGDCFFRFDQYSDNKWVLSYKEGPDWKKVADGTKKRCLEIMRAETKRYKAQLAQEAQQPTPPAISSDKRRTRNAPTTVSEECYDSEKRQIGSTPTSATRYSIRYMSNKLYRIVCREGSTGPFHLLTKTEFVDSDAAYAYFMLAAGAESLEFSNARHQTVEFDSAVFCNRHMPGGLVEVHKFDGNAWEKLAEGTAAEMRDWHEPESETFYDNLFAKCGLDKAEYKEYIAQPGILHHLYKKEADGWKSIKRGSPSDITQYKSMLRDLALQSLESERSKANEVKDTPAAKPDAGTQPASTVTKDTAKTANKFPSWSPSGRRPAIEDVLWNEIKNTTWLFKEDVAAYIDIMTRRNRHIGQSPVYDTRLYDSMNQPIYIADMDFNNDRIDPGYVNIGQLRIFKALYEVQAVFPHIQTLPAPIQLSQDPADYLWDPTSKILPITLHTIEHILTDRETRLPKEFDGVQQAVLMEYLSDEVSKGEARAMRDPFFALPCYSREDDVVSMMLPIHSPMLTSKHKIVAALILRKGARGYQVRTLLTGAMAVKSVSLFCDPRNTWLRECYEDAQRSVDS